MHGDSVSSFLLMINTDIVTTYDQLIRFPPDMFSTEQLMGHEPRTFGFRGRCFSHKKRFW